MLLSIIFQLVGNKADVDRIFREECISEWKLVN